MYLELSCPLAMSADVIFTSFINPSATSSVKTTCCTILLWPWLQPNVLRIERDRSILQHITWNVPIIHSLRFIKSRVGVAQFQKLLQVPDVLADVNHLEIRIPLHLLLHILAVRAGLHYIHLYHI